MESDKIGSQSGTIDTSGLEASFANVFEVLSSPGEISLVFGAIDAPFAGYDAELTASLLNRIIISPYIAKRLARLLIKKIDAYEAVYGTLIQEVSTDSIEEKSSLYEDAPRYASEEIADKAEFLKQLVDNLGVKYGFERSFKISDHLLLMNRFILGIKKDVLPDNSETAIMSILRQMEMPAAFMDKYRELLPTAKFLHFGFEEQQKGCLYKAYLEFSIPVKPDPGGARVIQEPFQVFMGFKWDPFDNNRRATSHYTCYPLLSPEEIQEKLSSLFKENPDCKSLEAARYVLRQAVKGVPNNRIIYEEVCEENNPRKSFDMNLYGAELCIRDVYPLLMDIGRHYKLSSDIFKPLCDRISGKRFGHLSGGIDREGKDFLTVYYGVEERTGKVSS